MNPELKKNLSSSHYWFRALYVLFFVFASAVAATILLFFAVGQIIFTLLTGNPNQRLTAFGSSLAEYLFSVFNFACCKTQDKPFPFTDWPEIVTVVEACEKSADSSTTQINEPINNAQNQGQDTSVIEKTLESAKSEQSDEVSDIEGSKKNTDPEIPKPKDA